MRITHTQEHRLGGCTVRLSFGVRGSEIPEAPGVDHGTMQPVASGRRGPLGAGLEKRCVVVDIVPGPDEDGVTRLTLMSVDGNVVGELVPNPQFPGNGVLE